MYRRWSCALTIHFFAPTLCYPSQFIVLLPQLAEPLSLLLQTSLKLQNQDLRENRNISITISTMKSKDTNKENILNDPFLGIESQLCGLDGWLFGSVL